MPTRTGRTEARGPSAADVVEKHRKELIRRWMRLFPRARWTREEAREASTAVVDSISSFLRTGKSSHLKRMATAQLVHAARKGTPLQSGLAFLGSTVRDLIDVLISSSDLDRKNLKAALSETARALEYLNTLAARSLLRQTSAAEELLRRISFHEGILQNPGVAIFAADSRGKIVVWNKGAEKMSGIKRSAVVGRKLPGVLALGESDSARISEENLSKAFSQLARRSGTKQRKKRFAAAGSVSKITDEAGHLLGTTGVAFDLTELRLAERSARESQKLLQTILDSIDDLVAMTGEGRRLIFTNKAIEKLTGFTTRDLQQAGPPPYHNMMLDKEKARVDAQWQKLLSSSRPGTIELPIPTKEGKDRLVEWKTIRIEDKKEKRFGVVSVGRDMTERIKAEKESELLLDLSASLGKTLELAKTLAEALEKTMHVFGADAGLIAGLEKKTGRLNMLAHKGMEPEIVSKLEQRRASNGWTATVIKTRRPLVVEDIRKSPYRAEAYTEAIRAGYRSFMSLPLIFKNEVFGVFEMASTQKSQFSTSDLNLCASIANILSSAVHNAILHNELAKRQKELTELSRKLSSAEEDERKRISAELHDEAAQLLVAARANMALAAKQLGKSNPKARRTLRETTELISHALDQVRDICHGLHPALLDDIGLSGAVRWLAKNTARTSGVQVRVNSSGLKERLPGPVEASLFRIVQETLNNIARHSKADRAAVNISRSDSQIKITIKDNGVGFDTERECKAPKGLGLRTLAQRVRWLGGELRLESDRGKGTLVEIQIPMEGHRNEKD